MPVCHIQHTFSVSPVARYRHSIHYVSLFCLVCVTTISLLSLSRFPDRALIVPDFRPLVKDFFQPPGFRSVRCALIVPLSQRLVKDCFESHPAGSRCLSPECSVVHRAIIVPRDTRNVKNFLQLFTARCPVSLPGALGVLLTVLILPESNRNVNRKFEKSFRKSDSCGIW